MSGQEFQLGERVTITQKLHRSTRDRLQPHTLLKLWEPAELAAPQSGIIVGKRTLVNGYITFEEYGTRFTPEQYFPAYLVAQNMRDKPVYVLRVHIIPAESLDS